MLDLDQQLLSLLWVWGQHQQPGWQQPWGGEGAAWMGQWGKWPLAMVEMAQAVGGRAAAEQARLQQSVCSLCPSPFPVLAVEGHVHWGHRTLDSVAGPPTAMHTPASHGLPVTQWLDGVVPWSASHLWTVWLTSLNYVNNLSLICKSD